MSKSNKKELSVTPLKKDSEATSDNPLKALRTFEEMDNMFDEFFSRGWMRPFRFSHPSWSHLPAPFKGRTPQVNVIDRDNEVYIKAELPGIDKDDIDISITSNSVTIKGSTKEEAKEEKGDFHRYEISEGSFSRSLSLPSEVDTDGAKAKFKHGVLKLTIPKVKKSLHKTVKID